MYSSINATESVSIRRWMFMFALLLFVGIGAVGCTSSTSQSATTTPPVSADEGSSTNYEQNPEDEEAGDSEDTYSE